MEKQHIFVIGAKGIPGAYGGYETFVDKLTAYHQSLESLQYHVACKGREDRVYEYHGARCFQIKVPDIGPAQAIWYDVEALRRCCDYMESCRIEHPIVYILACRIGPFAAHFQKRIHKLGGVLYVNPDGHEWMRAKWSAPVRWYWKLSEGMMVRQADLLICDSRNIEAYIQREYGRYSPKTTYIAYGAETSPSPLPDTDGRFTGWLEEKGLTPQEYYLVVGRFVPENNYETMLREFMRSRTPRNLVIITNVNEKFLNELERKLHFRVDPRVRFVGTVYDQELLKKIRENAYGYLHGHEVGGTNPSLLEAMGSTELNLLLDVGFNREVGGDAALYWGKEAGNLAGLIEKADNMDAQARRALADKAKNRIRELYSWERIAGAYEKLFLKR